MLVLKFSGTAIADVEPIRRAAGIAAAAPRPAIVVVSALAGVTDRLLQIAQLAETGRLSAAGGILERVAERHRRIVYAAAEGAPEALALIGRVCDEVRARIQAAADLRSVTPASRDAILAAGEVIGSRVIAAAFDARGVPTTWMDARRVFVSDDRHGSASPDAARTSVQLEAIVAPLMAAGRVPVLAGFIGATVDGVTTTLGRGASDLSAALVAAHFGAREIQIWTDRGGLPAADPALVPRARPVAQLSYAEARELTCFGATVVHASAIDPAGSRGIPVRLLNVRRPDVQGTVVNGVPAGGAGPAALACKRHVTVIEIATPAAVSSPAFARRVFEAFDEARLRPCVTAASHDRVVAAFDGAAGVDELARTIEPSARVTVRTDMALLSAVGETLRTSPRLAADLLGALDGLPVHGVSQPPSGLSWTVLLEEADLRDAVNRLYDRFYAGTEDETP